MAVRLQSPDEIEAMALAGEAARSVLDDALSACRAGETTQHIARLVREAIAGIGAEPLFEGYGASAAAGRAGFPAAACICVNDEVVHGVPGDRVLDNGDLVTIDVGLRLDGWCGDVADSVVVGGQAGVAADLIQRCRGVVAATVATMGPGVSWAEAAAAGRAVAGADDLFVAGYVGHAIGRELHEPLALAYVDVAGDPVVPGGPGDFRLWPGMCVTVEPILALGSSAETTLDADGWIVRLASGGLAAQVERSVAITPEGVRLLTGPIGR